MAERSVLLVLGASTGGIGTHVAALAADCVEAGWLVTVCGPPETEQLFDFSSRGARFVAAPVGMRLVARRSARRALRRLVAQHPVAHAHGLQAGVVTSLLARHVPVVVTWHNAPLSSGARRMAHVLLERVAARAATVTVGASPDLVVRAERAGARQARFVPVAPPPAQQPSAPVTVLRERLGVGQAPVVLAVGRLHRQKRLDVLVDAALRWQARRPLPQVLVVGDGPERESLQARASAVPGVRFLGRRNDVADLLAVADVVVLPSEWEARPLVAQEALSAGRALVATPVGGVPALVGPAAVLVAVGDAAALADAVTRLLDDQGERHALEALARAQAASWPDAHAVGEQLRRLYGDVEDGS